MLASARRPHPADAVVSSNDAQEISTAHFKVTFNYRYMPLRLKGTDEGICVVVQRPELLAQRAEKCLIHGHIYGPTSSIYSVK